MRRRPILLLAGAAALALALTVAVDVSTLLTTSPEHRYSSVDVIEYLAFTQGPIVRDNPELALPATVEGQESIASQSRAAAQIITDCIAVKDGAAISDVTEAFNTAAAVRLDPAISGLDEAAKRWLNDPIPRVAPCPPTPSPPTSAPDGGGSYFTHMISQIYVNAVNNVQGG